MQVQGICGRSARHYSLRESSVLDGLLTTDTDVLLWDVDNYPSSVDFVDPYNDPEERPEPRQDQPRQYAA